MRVWRGLGRRRRAEVRGRSGGRRLQGEDAVGLGAAGRLPVCDQPVEDLAASSAGLLPIAPVVRDC